MNSEIKNRRFWLFLLRVLVFAGITIGIIVGINYSVDASHVITSRSQEEMAKLALEGNIVAVPENYNERTFQMAILDRMSALPETAVVGASRGMFLGKDITGFDNIYNNCIAGASIEDYYAVLGLYRQKFGKYPSRVILEVSPWVFYAGNPELRWTEIYTYRTAAGRLWQDLNHKKLEIKAPEIKPAASQGKPFYSRENPYFSLPYFQYNYGILREKGTDAFKGDPARVSTDPAEAAEYPDGTIRYPASQENESEERLAKVRASAGPVTYEYVQHMTEIDEDKRLAFEALVRELQDHGTEVLFWLSPFSETQCRYSFDEDLNPAFRIVEDYLRGYAAESGIKIIGSYDARNYGLTDDRFIDYMHADKQGAKIVWSADN